MRIGISVISHAGQNIWENGMGQNVFFLAQALKAVPFVSSIVLIDVGDQGVLPEQVNLDQLQLRLLKQGEATDQVDVIIELAGALDPSWLALQRARGKKVVYYCVGQPHVGLAETSIFDRHGSFPAAGRSDQVWLLPKDAAYLPMMRTINRCPVEIAPYLWSPGFLQDRVQEIARQGHHYGWKSQAAGSEKRALRIAIFEPNVSVVKTSSIPMLVCDEAYRAEPASVQMMNVLNTLHMKDHNTMLYFANSLNLVREHKACFHGRHDIAGFMAQFADTVVSHQWGNDQNYSYLDALYGDYPLIHNSPWLHSFGAGYYYQGFEAVQGSQQLLTAWSEHDERLPDQRRATQAVFAATDPLSVANVQEHIRLLTQLCADAPQLLEAA